MDNHYQQQEGYKHFRKGAILTTQLVEDSIKLNMSMDGVKVDGWNIRPLVEPMVIKN